MYIEIQNNISYSTNSFNNHLSSHLKIKTSRGDNYTAGNTHTTRMYCRKGISHFLAKSIRGFESCWHDTFDDDKNVVANHLYLYKHTRIDLGTLSSTEIDPQAKHDLQTAV